MNAQGQPSEEAGLAFAGLVEGKKGAWHFHPLQGRPAGVVQNAYPLFGPCFDVGAPVKRVS